MQPLGEPYSEVSLCAPYNRGNMLIPPRQRRGLFGGIGRPVIDAGDAALVAADVVQYRLDHVRLYTDVGHAGRDRAAKVVKDPVVDAGAFTEKVLRIGPGRKLEGGAS